MNIKKELWSSSFSERTRDNWVGLLDVVCRSLSDYLGLSVQVQHYNIYDSGEMEAHKSIAASVKVDVSAALNTCFLGYVTISVNMDERVNISSGLLLFVAGARMSQHHLIGNGVKDNLWLKLTPAEDKIGCWSFQGLDGDEAGEWEEYLCLDDWYKAHIPGWS